MSPCYAAKFSRAIIVICDGRSSGSSQNFALQFSRSRCVCRDPPQSHE